MMKLRMESKAELEAKEDIAYLTVMKERHEKESCRGERRNSFDRKEDKP
jgi:hypothetical protein